MSEFNDFGLPDLGHIEEVKDSCRDKCPEGRPQEAEASLREEYEGRGQDLDDGIDPDLEASAMDIMPLTQRQETFAKCFADCNGPLRNRLGLGKTTCGMAINELRDQLADEGK